MLVIEQLINENRIVYILIFISCFIKHGDGQGVLPEHDQRLCKEQDVLCPPNVEHITCPKKNWEIDLTNNRCRYGTVIEIDNKTQRMILHNHNMHRNKIAGGEYKRFESATRMAKMSWDPALAQMARLNVMQCRSIPDLCHNTFNYPHSGQILDLYLTKTSEPEDTYATKLPDIIGRWYSLCRYTDASCMRKYQEKREPIKEFALGVSDRNHKVGCAYLVYTEDNVYNFYDDLHRYFILCCDYSTIVVEGKEVYHAGPVASDCQTGRDHEFQNLCSFAEVFDSSYPPDPSFYGTSLYKAMTYVSIAVLLIIILTALAISVKYISSSRR